MEMSLPDYAHIIRNISYYFKSKVGMEKASDFMKMRPSKVFDSLSRMEKALSYSIRLAQGQAEKEFVDHLIEQLEQMVDSNDLLGGAFLEFVRTTGFSQRLAKLVSQYGNGVWAPVFMSALVPLLVEVMRPHIILTNPPWVPFTEYKAPYIKLVREVASKLILRVLKLDRKRAASIVTGSDIACLALHKALQTAREGVGFVMNREQ